MSKSKLGGGAASLLGSLAVTEPKDSLHIAVDKIHANPEQPRRYFDEEKLNELAHSIKQNGVLQPLLVEKQGLEYLLIAGERRLRAAKLAGLTQVPALIKNFTNDQKLEVALIENIQREDLTAIEQALTYQQLIDLLKLSHEALADRLGKSRSAVTNTLRLLQLPKEMQANIEQGVLSAGHARTLLSLDKKPELQKKLYEAILKEGISVRQAEESAKQWQQELAPAREKTKVSRSQELVKQERRLMENLGVKLQIKGDEARGTITIRYHSKEKLNHILSLLEENKSNE